MVSQKAIGMNECTGIYDSYTSCDAQPGLPSFVMAPGSSYQIRVAKDGSNKVSVDKDGKLANYSAARNGDSTSTIKKSNDSTRAVVVDTTRISDDPRTQQSSTSLDQSRLDQWYRIQSANYKQVDSKHVDSKKDGIDWNALLAALINGGQTRSRVNSIDPYWYYPAGYTPNSYSDDSFQRSYLSRMNSRYYGYPSSERTSESYLSRPVRTEPLITFADTPSAPALITPRIYTRRGATM